MIFFKSKKPIEPVKEVSQVNVDLELVTKMNQDFALSLPSCFQHTLQKNKYRTTYSCFTSSFYLLLYFLSQYWFCSSSKLSNL